MISIGNLTSGGSGKTPFCIYLAKLLSEGGVSVGISHRGYRGALERFASLISDGDRLLYGVEDSGDEAALLARRLPGIPIVVGKERRAAVSLLLAWRPELQMVLLDDAFQHVKIARDLDIVCFDAVMGLGNGRTLPAGYLREPLSALSADTLAVLISKQKDCSNPSLEEALARRRVKVIKCHYEITGLIRPDGSKADLGGLRGQPVVAVCGIASPDSFAVTLRDAGLDCKRLFAYPDHYAYADQQEIDRILAACTAEQATAIVCTEKDLVKLQRHPELSGVLCSLAVDLSCASPQGLRDEVLERLGL